VIPSLSTTTTPSITICVIVLSLGSDTPKGSEDEIADSTAGEASHDQRRPDWALKSTGEVLYIDLTTASNKEEIRGGEPNDVQNCELREHVHRREAEWPHNVVQMTHTENPSGITIKDIGAVEWCGCQFVSSPDSCPIHLVAYFAVRTTAWWVLSAETDIVMLADCNCVKGD
jgi:hypothetical protein